MIKTNRNEKKGVSLIVLLITIVVILILVTVIVISVDNVSNNAKLSAFATDLSTIEDLTNTYYMQNNSFPINVESGKEDEDMLMTQGELLDKVGADNRDKFIEELKLNNDYNEENDDLGEYYPIDLSKLNVDSSKRGTLKDGDTEDIYVVAYPSMNVYYIKGLKIKKDMYFSLSSKLTNRVKLDKDMTYKSDNTTSIQSIDGLTVKKMTKSWTNSMGIYVQANLKSDEELYLEASGVAKKKLITFQGNNEFNFNDLSEINGFSSDESATFKNSDQKNKRLIFTKQKGADVLGKIEVDMSNYETELPTYMITPSNIIYSEEYNMIPFKVADSTSGIKEVRYEYLTKYDNNGNLQNYYSNTTEYDVEYLKSKGKKAIADKDGNIVLKVDKDIQGIQLIVIDRAGNVLSRNNNNEALKIGLYNEPDDIYIGFNTKINVENLFSYSLVILSNKNILNFTCEFLDENMNSILSNIIYVSEKKSYYSENKITNKRIIQYVKITVINIDGKEVNRLFKVNEKATLELGKIVDQNITFDLQDTGTYYNPIIPKGFAPINDGDAKWGTASGWTKGLVIKDERGNEFVWVPVDGGNTKYEKDYTTNITYLRDDNLPSGITDETVDVQKHGGFYISRYEAGVPDAPTSVDGASAQTSNVEGMPTSKKGKVSWTYINYANAKKNAESMINTDSVQSGLLTGTAWDTACKWIENSGKDVNDSTSYGNYRDSVPPANVTGYGEKQVTGFSEYWKVNNIYDLAGNVMEWTNEKKQEIPSEIYAIGRGGFSDKLSDNYPVSFRHNYDPESSAYVMGFRIRLYIK